LSVQDPNAPATAPAAQAATPEIAPASIPGHTPLPSLEGDGGENYDPSQELAALAQMREAAKAAAPPAAPTAPEVPAPAATPEAPKAEPQDDFDAKAARYFNKVAALEKERDTARAELEQLRARAKRADELENAKTPEEYFKARGWGPEVLQDYILNGPKAVAPEIVEVKSETAKLREELAALRAERQQADQARQIEQYKASIPAQLGDGHGLQYLGAYYAGNKQEMADHVFNVMEAAYRKSGTQLSVLEAAKAIDKALGEQARRFQSVSQSAPAQATNAPAQASPSAPSLNNRTPVAAPEPRKSTETPDFLPNYDEAVQLLRSSTNRK
jgi:hypothetical protein